MTTDIVRSLNDLNRETQRLKKKFESSMPSHSSSEEFEWKFEEALNDWWENGEEEFNELISKHDGLMHKNFEDMRIRTYYWSKTHRCKCMLMPVHSYETRRPCCHTCHNGQIYFAEDLDYYYGIELYQYDLIIGGPNHGDLIVNGGHPENDNEDDIVYKLVTDNDSTIHIESFKAFVYEHFDYYETIEQENNKKRHDFNQFLERFRVNGINEIYTILRNNYASIIGYTYKKRRAHNAILGNANRLLLDIKDRLGKEITNEYRVSLLLLRDNISEVKRYVEDIDYNIMNCVHQLQEQNNTSHVGSKILSYL